MVDGLEVEDVKAVVAHGYDQCAETYLAARPDDGADVAELAPLLGALGPGAAVLDAGCGAGVPVTERLVDAVVSYYAIIHVPRVEHHRVFAEIHRVLRPGGYALLCLGWGDLPDDLDPDSWLGVPMYWSHFDADTNVRLLGDAGLVVRTSTEVTDPMDHHSHQFVLASRP
jgi:hypothetical protein